ncbi:MAG: NUDIX domain-containing protein [Patescibacteria group bacterium]|jgi:8-oxo-dGTP pyrophosphatase MutT (NUDIX family)
MDKDNKQKDRYFVAVKVFLEKGGKLLILKDAYGHWDLPGGRIKRNEFDAPLDQIIKRKLSEELGLDLKYELCPSPEIFMRHKREEQMGDDPEARIFALGYIATLEAGIIKLSDAHTETKWIEPEAFVPEDYFSGGWLDGVRQYIYIKKQRHR